MYSSFLSILPNFSKIYRSTLLIPFFGKILSNFYLTDALYRESDFQIFYLKNTPDSYRHPLPLTYNAPCSTVYYEI